MQNKICFHCDKTIEDPLDYNIMPLDVPYVNLFLHKGCLKLAGGYDNMSVYLTQNREKVYNYCINLNKEGKNNRNDRKNTKTI